MFDVVKGAARSDSPDTTAVKENKSDSTPVLDGDGEAETVSIFFLLIVTVNRALCISFVQLQEVLESYYILYPCESYTKHLQRTFLFSGSPQSLKNLVFEDLMPIENLFLRW